MTSSTGAIALDRGVHGGGCRHGPDEIGIDTSVIMSASKQTAGFLD